ncbi:MAG TPA: Uma2 family endonuclease [Bryobacteraceae bacterium]|jgi:Uma2 family endonuclease
MMATTDRKRELNNGVIVEIEIARAEHELVKTKLNMLLARSIPDGLVVAPEAENRLSDRTTRIPDLAIWKEADLERMDPARTIVGGPLIAIEIISSETAEDLDEKILQYFAAGTQAVWAIYPKTRTVVIERPDGAIRLGVHDSLQDSGLLPGFEIPVAAIFALLRPATPSRP